MELGENLQGLEGVTDRGDELEDHKEDLECLKGSKSGLEGLKEEPEGELGEEHKEELKEEHNEKLQEELEEELKGAA